MLHFSIPKILDGKILFKINFSKLGKINVTLAMICTKFYLNPLSIVNLNSLQFRDNKM